MIIIALLTALFCVAWALWVHGLLIHAVRKEVKSRFTVAVVDGLKVVIQPKYFCEKCNNSLRTEKLFFGMQLYECSQGHRYIARGKGRLTPVSQILSDTLYK